MRIGSSAAFMSVLRRDTGFSTMVVITDCLAIKNTYLRGVPVTNSLPVDYVEPEEDGNARAAGCQAAKGRKRERACDGSRQRTLYLLLSVM